MDCSETCQAGRLEHAIRLAQSLLERIASQVGQLDCACPNLGLKFVWNDLCEVIDDLETDIQASRNVYNNIEPLLMEMEHPDVTENENTHATRNRGSHATRNQPRRIA